MGKTFRREYNSDEKIPEKLNERQFKGDKEHGQLKYSTKKRIPLE